jgi:hypothetical protein
MTTGPLSGYRIIEIAGIGPGPFAAMMLADMGAEVIRVERAQSVRGPAPDTAHWDVLLRGRKNIAIDLKNPQALKRCCNWSKRPTLLLKVSALVLWNAWVLVPTCAQSATLSWCLVA